MVIHFYCCHQDLNIRIYCVYFNGWYCSSGDCCKIPQYFFNVAQTGLCTLELSIVNSCQNYAQSTALSELWSIHKNLKEDQTTARGASLTLYWGQWNQPVSRQKCPIKWESMGFYVATSSWDARSCFITISSLWSIDVICDIDMELHWSRLWLIAWRHQAIARTSVGKS